MFRPFKKIEIRHKLINLKVTLREYDRIKAMADKHAGGNISRWIRAIASHDPQGHMTIDIDEEVSKAK